MEKVKTSLSQEERLRMSYEDFLAWADEDIHAEWVDGEVIVQMPPKTRHQTIVNFLSTLLTVFVEFFRLGQVLTAPFEMKVAPESPAREPDILFIAGENLARLTENRLDGPADLIIEVISDESIARDRGDKFYEYQEAGVREYWIIDPRPGKERADFWVLDRQGRYQPIPIGDDERYQATVIPDFWLSLAWLQAEEMPDPLLTLAEIASFPPEVVETLRQIAARGPG